MFAYALIARLGWPSFSAFCAVLYNSSAVSLTSSSPGATNLAFLPGRKTTDAVTDSDKIKVTAVQSKATRIKKSIECGRVVDLSIASRSSVGQIESRWLMFTTTLQ